MEETPAQGVAMPNHIVYAIPEKLPSMVSVLSPPSKTSSESQFCSVTKLITWILDKDKKKVRKNGPISQMKVLICSEEQRNFLLLDTEELFLRYECWGLGHVI